MTIYYRYSSYNEVENIFHATIRYNFDIYIFQIITIEYNLVLELAEKLEAFMTSKGYKLYRTVHVDKIYMHSSVWPGLWNGTVAKAS